MKTFMTLRRNKTKLKRCWEAQLSTSVKSLKSSSKITQVSKQRTQASRIAWPSWNRSSAALRRNMRLCNRISTSCEHQHISDGEGDHAGEKGDRVNRNHYSAEEGAGREREITEVIGRTTDSECPDGGRSA